MISTGVEDAAAAVVDVGAVVVGAEEEVDVGAEPRGPAVEAVEDRVVAAQAEGAQVPAVEVSRGRPAGEIGAARGHPGEMSIEGVAAIALPKDHQMVGVRAVAAVWGQAVPSHHLAGETGHLEAMASRSCHRGIGQIEEIVPRSPLAPEEEALPRIAPHNFPRAPAAVAPIVLRNFRRVLAAAAESAPTVPPNSLRVPVEE